MAQSITKRTPSTTPKKQPLKIWNDWSGGVGHVVDEGKNGMSYAAGLLGLPSELRAGPFQNTTNPGLTLHSHWYSVGPFGFPSSATSLLTAAFAAQTGTTAVSLNETLYQTTATGTTFSFSHSVTSLTKLLVVAVSWGGTEAVGGQGPAIQFTDSGSSTTILTPVVTAGTKRADIRYMKNPVAGSGTVQVSFSGEGITVVPINIVAYDLFRIDTGTVVDSWAGFDFSVGQNIYGRFGVELDAKAKDILISSLGVAYPTGASFVTDPRASTAGTTSFLDDGSSLLGSQFRTATTVDACHLNRAFEAYAESTSSKVPYLYAQTAKLSSEQVYPLMQKVSMSNTDFGTMYGYHQICSVEPLQGGAQNSRYGQGHPPGQCARYRGDIWIPMGTSYSHFRLDAVKTGNASQDTVATGTGPDELGGQHLISMWRDQIALYRAHSLGSGAGGGGYYGGGGSGGESPGTYLLIPGSTDPQDSTHWGSAFPTGDSFTDALCMAVLEGLCYVYKEDGLYTFNDASISKLVFRELGQWNIHINGASIDAWKGTLLVPTPSNLLLFEPGGVPTPIGIGSQVESMRMTPKGVTQLIGGVYHSVRTIGDYIYAIYQPDISSTTVHILCGYSPTGDPTSVVWQSLGTFTLIDASAFLDIFVSRTSQPISANYPTPCVWFGKDTAFNYYVLDQRGGPFRLRADTHKTVQSGTAYMSELVFPEPVSLDELVVYAQDMGANDEFQLSVIVNGDGNEINLGSPIKASGRSTRPLRSYDYVTRLTVGLTFTTTDTSSRVPPNISQMELYGDPA